METLKLTRPVLEASLPKYSFIQKLNFVIPIFHSIFQNSKNPDDLNQIRIFTAQYVAYRLKNTLDPDVSTYLNPLPATAAAPAPAPASIIQPSFYTIPLLFITHTKITRKILIQSLSILSTDEKLNLILAIYDNIARDESDLNRLTTIMSGYVRFAIRSIAIKSKKVYCIK